MLKMRLADVCKESDFLLEEDAVNSADSEIFKQLCYGISFFQKQAKAKRLKLLEIKS